LAGPALEVGREPEGTAGGRRNLFQEESHLHGPTPEEDEASHTQLQSLERPSPSLFHGLAVETQGFDKKEGG
jgi:hypothetical protein